MWKLVMRLAVLSLVGVVLTTGIAVTSDAATTSDTSPSCGGERPADPTGGSYVCTFTDDFDGSTFDTSKWTAQDSSFSGMTSANADCYQDSPQTVAVSDGAAHISSVRTPAPFTCHSPYGDFSSNAVVGTLATINHFAQAYGRFEFRARFPQTTVAGAHAALWLYPATSAYGAWPNSGEIDVAEWYSGQPTYVFPSVHYAGEVPWDSSGKTCQTPTSSSYHDYAVDWTPTMMYFSMDGVRCWQYSWLDLSPLPGSAPFDQPFYMVLTQVYDPVADAATAASLPTATMDVDWVRAWKSVTSAGPDPTSTRPPRLGRAILISRRG